MKSGKAGIKRFLSIVRGWKNHFRLGEFIYF